MPVLGALRGLQPSASPRNYPFTEPRPRSNPHRRRPAPRGSVQKIVSEVPKTAVVRAGFAVRHFRYNPRLYDAENRITKALPKMAKAATSPALKAAFEKHLAETRDQVDRLEQVFEHLGEKAKKHTCKAMQGLLEEGEETIKEDAEPDVKDAALIAAAQRVEHYEMAGYGTVRAYAKLLN